MGDLFKTVRDQTGAVLEIVNNLQPKLRFT